MSGLWLDGQCACVGLFGWCTMQPLAPGPLPAGLGSTPWRAACPASSTCCWRRQVGACCTELLGAASRQCLRTFCANVRTVAGVPYDIVEEMDEVNPKVRSRLPSMHATPRMLTALFLRRCLLSDGLMLPAPPAPLAPPSLPADGVVRPGAGHRRQRHSQLCRPGGPTLGHRRQARRGVAGAAALQGWGKCLAC